MLPVVMVEGSGEEKSSLAGRMTSSLDTHSLTPASTMIDSDGPLNVDQVTRSTTCLTYEELYRLNQLPEHIRLQTIPESTREIRYLQGNTLVIVRPKQLSLFSVNWLSKPEPDLPADFERIYKELEFEPMTMAMTVSLTEKLTSAGKAMLSTFTGCIGNGGVDVDNSHSWSLENANNHKLHSVTMSMIEMKGLGSLDGSSQESIATTTIEMYAGGKSENEKEVDDQGKQDEEAAKVLNEDSQVERHRYLVDTGVETDNLSSRDSEAAINSSKASTITEISNIAENSSRRSSHVSLTPEYEVLQKKNRLLEKKLKQLIHSKMIELDGSPLELFDDDEEGLEDYLAEILEDGGEGNNISNDDDGRDTPFIKSPFSSADNLITSYLDPIDDTMIECRPIVSHRTEPFTGHLTFAPSILLMDAAREGQLSHLKNLFTLHNYEIDFYDECGYTALHYAAAYGHIDVIKWLLKRGADINAISERDAYTALHIAVNEGFERVVKLLLERGANVEALTVLGQTPMTFAVDHPIIALLQSRLDRKNTAKTVHALYHWNEEDSNCPPSREAGTLPVSKGEKLRVIGRDHPIGWWLVRNRNGEIGRVPRWFIQ